jgi:NADPH:quinone reductase-like Zn-dependent oxidoreductase
MTKKNALDTKLAHLDLSHTHVARPVCSMMPLGSLSGSFYGKAIGIEACGIITALGPQAPAHLHVGDRVITTSGHSFASFQNAPHSCVYPLPSHMSFEMGAAVISAYTAAHYALVHLANVRKGAFIEVHLFLKPFAAA